MTNEKVVGLSGIKLAIATPFYSVSAFSPYVTSLVRTITFLNKHTDVDVDFWELSGDSYVDRARNSIAKRFLDSDRTHLFFIDSDESWTVEGFIRVLMSPGDIVGAGYPCKNVWDFYSVVFRENPDGSGRPIVNEHGLVNGWIVPTGFMKIHRSVFERLVPHVAHLTCADPKGGEPVISYDFFGRMPPLGEDGSFNMRCEQIGIQRWVQPKVTISHFGVEAHTGNLHEHLMALPGGVNGPEVEA